MDLTWLEIRSQIGWLLAQGDAVIRWRIANDLLDPSDPVREELDLIAMQKALLQSPQVLQWLGYLRQAVTDWRWHHSRPDTIENALGKLLDFGLRRGMAPFDEALDPLRTWLVERHEPDQMGGQWNNLCRSIAAWGLTRAGYHEPAAAQYLQRRLDALYELASSGRTDIHIDPDTYGDLPANRRGLPLVSPDLYDDPTLGVRLPSIHDLLGLAQWPLQMDTSENQRKRDAVVAYVLHPEVQAWPVGYGLMRVGPRRYYSIGWDVRLPGHQALPPAQNEARYLLPRLLMLAPLAVAREHPWFARCTAYLDSLRTTTGWRFPAEYLLSRNSGYWVTGANTALMAGRRTAAVREIESTFYRLLILYRSGL